MSIFSKEIQNILKSYSENYQQIVAQIPKSRSSIGLGDLLLFRYNLGTGAKDYRIVLVVRPVMIEPGTRNLLLTGVKVFPPMQINPLDLYDLYKNRDKLPEDNYRTYKVKSIYGPLFRIANIAQ